MFHMCNMLFWRKTWTCEGEQADLLTLSVDLPTELRLLCDNCGGTGRVKDETGHTDVCTVCFGLGYREVAGKEDEGTRRRSRRFYIIASLVAVVLGAYYVMMYIAVEVFNINLFETMMLLIAGHVIIFGGVFTYALMRVLRGNGE